MMNTVVFALTCLACVADARHAVQAEPLEDSRQSLLTLLTSSPAAAFHPTIAASSPARSVSLPSVAARVEDLSMMARAKAAAKRSVAKKAVAKKAPAKRVVKKRAAPKKVTKRVVKKVTRAVPADLLALADAQQIPMGYWDPLKLGESRIFGQSNEATIGFLRHAEIKHGRVAMAGFVGYCIHENGIRWPFPLSTSLPDYSSFEGLSAPAVWNAVPQAGRLQIFALIGLLEWWSEFSPALEKDGEAHYMRGGKPGYFPKFNEPYPLNLYDPFGLFKDMGEEVKAKRLNREVNNGRLAMLGMMSLVSEARVPGAVPALKGLIKQYDGEVMAPLSPTLDTNWQGVDAMFEVAKKFPWNQ